jgi:hypothetical protein
MMYVDNDGEIFYRSTLKSIQLHTVSAEIASRPL